MKMNNNNNNTFKSIIADVQKSVRSSSHSNNYKPTEYIHPNNHYEILLIKKGGGKHSIDFNDYPVLDNQVFFLKPGQMHRFSPEKKAEFYFLALDKEHIELNSNIALSQFDYFRSFNTFGYMIFDNIDELIHLIGKIQKELGNKSNTNNQDIIISSYIVIFLVKIQQKFQELKYDKKIKSRYSPLVIEFNKLIDSESVQQRFVSEYAKLLFVSANYLNERVKLETGESASHWIHQSLMIAIKKQLIKNNESLKEIATKFGFPSSAHLIRFFKKNQNMTPKTFRNTYRV